MPRSRFVLFLALAAAIAVLVPAGVGARSLPRHRQAAVDARCSDVERLAATERDGLAGRLDDPGAAPVYRARLHKLVSDGCKRQKDCGHQRRNMAALVDARAGTISGSLDAGLVAAEQAFLRKFCSS